MFYGRQALFTCFVFIVPLPRFNVSVYVYMSMCRQCYLCIGDNYICTLDVEIGT